MKLVIVFFLLCTLHTLARTSPPIKSNVVNLDDGSYEEEITGKVAVVEFYAPWCAHCKALIPIWEKLANTLHERGHTDLLVGKVDCTLNPDVCTKAAVAGYPTIQIITKTGSTISYAGDRSYDDLLKFVDKNAAPLLAAVPGFFAGETNKEAQGGNKKTGRDRKKRATTTNELSVLVVEILEDMWFDHPYLCAVLLIMIGFSTGVLVGVGFVLRENSTPTPRRR